MLACAVSYLMTPHHLADVCRSELLPHQVTALEELRCVSFRPLLPKLSTSSSVNSLDLTVSWVLLSVCTLVCKLQ